MYTKYITFAASCFSQYYFLSVFHENCLSQIALRTKQLLNPYIISISFNKIIKSSYNFWEYQKQLPPALKCVTHVSSSIVFVVEFLFFSFRCFCSKIHLLQSDYFFVFVLLLFFFIFYFVVFRLKSDIQLIMEIVLYYPPIYCCYSCCQ